MNPSYDFSDVENFNPRSREGSDKLGDAVKEFNINFNPRSREGSDKEYDPDTTSVKVFQSTLPRGERPKRGA